MLTPSERNALKQKLRSGVPVEDLPLRVADYARVSTTKAAQRSSLQNQLETYQEIIRENPHWQYVATYSDEGITGTRADIRGGFQSMMLDARLGRFDLLLVKSVSRFGRNTADALSAIRELAELGVMVKFYNENLNTWNEQDQIFLTVYAAVAEAESKNASARVKSTLERGIQKGKVYGTSHMLGYTKAQCQLFCHPGEAEIVRLIFNWYVYERMGTRRITKELAQRGLTKRDGSAISIKNVKDALANPKYKGWYCGGKSGKDATTQKRFLQPSSAWVLHPDDSVPQIVSEQLWDAAARIRSSRTHANIHAQKSTQVINDGKYAYSGCIEHELRPGKHYIHLIYRYRGIVREGWQNRDAMSGNLGPTLYTDELDQAVLSLLKPLLLPAKTLAQELIRILQKASDTISARNTPQSSSVELETEINKLFDLYLDSAITLEEFSQQKARCQNRYALSEKNTHAPVLSQELTCAIIQAAPKMRPNRALIQATIDRIIVRSTSTRQHLVLDFICLPHRMTHRVSIDRKATCEEPSEDGSFFLGHFLRLGTES